MEGVMGGQVRVVGRGDREGGALQVGRVGRVPLNFAPKRCAARGAAVSPLQFSRPARRPTPCGGANAAAEKNGAKRRRTLCRTKRPERGPLANFCTYLFLRSAPKSNHSHQVANSNWFHQ